MYSLQRIITNLLERRIKTTNNCWEWTGYRNPEGYGRIRFRNKYIGVHRLIAYICLNFDLNSPLKVCHKCDNPPCFNPVHLFIGNDKDNAQDRSKKGRHPPSWRKTHCKNGHEYTPENSYFHNGTRYCRACNLRSHLVPR